MTCLLAIDTATEEMHLALLAGAQVQVHAGAGGAQASAGLLPAVHALLAQAGLTLAQVDAFAFGRGPGAFTGIRTACAVTQGLALGTGRPVIAIDTLMAVAESARQAGATTPLWAATDARMGEVYAGCYAFDAVAGWRVVEPPALLKPAGLAARLHMQPLPVAGNAAERFAAVLAPVAAALWPAARPDGAALAALARAAYARGDLLDAAQAVPLYVRDKVAQTTVERDQARRAAAAAP